MNIEMDFSISEVRERQVEIEPLPLWGSILLFGIPALLMIVAIHYWLPRLELAGLDPFQAFIVAVAVPSALMFALAIVLYARVEGRPLTRQAFAARMWLGGFNWRHIVWALAIFIVGGVGYGLLFGMTQPLIDKGLLPVPQELPLMIDPRATIGPETLDQAAGGQLKGRWDLVIAFTVTWFFMVAGEELLWRGYILPRQVAQHGKYAWVVQGLLWNLFHFFKWWQLIALLPMTLAFAYASYRLKNNWPTMIAHFLGNLAFYVIVVLSVIGR